MRKRLTRNAQELTQLLKSSRLAFLLLMEILTGAYLSVISFLIFVKAGRLAWGGHNFSIDGQIIHTLYALRTPVLTEIMKIISFLGGDIFTVIAIIFLAIFLVLRHHRREAILFAFVLFINGLIQIILKDIIHRPRPTIAPLVIEHTYSFPSAHSMNSFVFYTMITYLTFHLTRRYRYTLPVVVICAAMIALIGISRIYLGVHYPSDVLAGYVGGLWWFATVMALDKTLTLFKLFKETKTEKLP